MQITKEYLLEQIEHMEKQRDHAHEGDVASQAAVDTLKAVLARLEASEPEQENVNAI